MKTAKLLFLGLLILPLFASAQNIGTLDQFTSTTTPSSAITQRTYGKSIKITGLSTLQTLCLDSNGLLTTVGCPSSSGSAYPFPLTGNATSTLTLFNGGLQASASSTLNNFTFFNATGTSAPTTNFFATNLFGTTLNFTGAGTFGNLVLTGSTTLQNFTGLNATTSQATTTSFFSTTGVFTNLTSTNTITGSITGLAGTATKLATARTLAITGDLTWTSPSFDGSGNVTAAGTLATVNANTGSFGGSNSFATFTVNGKGLITAAGSATPSIPASEITSGTFGTGNYVAPAGFTVTNTATTTNLYVSASSTLQNVTAVNATTTSATTTNFTVSGKSIIINNGLDTAYITGTTSPSFNIASTTLDAIGKSFNIGTTTLLLKNFPQAFTANGAYCVASSTGTAIMNLSHDNGNKTNPVVFTTGAYTPFTTNNTFTAFENFNIQASSTVGTVNRITCTIVGKYTSN